MQKVRTRVSAIAGGTADSMFIRPGIQKRIPGLFYITGKCFAFFGDTKSPPGRIALRRRGIILLKQSAAGGESCKAGFVLIERRKDL